MTTASLVHVHVLESVTIKASNKYNLPLSTRTISPHELDLISGTVHISNHRFFSRPENLSFQGTIDRLKSSLAEALELYRPVAGTVRLDEKGELVIVCDDEGASFVIETRDTPFEGDADHISPRPSPVLPTPSHVLAVKVTQFSCGTIAVATSIHHLVTDLAGFVDFLRLWAKIARNEIVDICTIQTDWSHTPSRYFPEPRTQSPLPPAGYKVFTSPQMEVPFFAEAEAQNWVMSANALNDLKSNMTKALRSETSKDSDAWISSGDAIAALLWGVITRARETSKVPRTGGLGRSSEESGIETLAMAADGRERSEGKKMVDAHYLGNFNLLFQTTVPRIDLLSADPDLTGTSRVALAIRRSLIAQLSPEAIADRIRFFEANSKPPGRILWSADTVATNWSKFDMEGEDMSFGWGRPFLASAGGGPFPGGFFRLLKKSGTGETLILVSVEKDGAQAMREDALLNVYAKFVDVVRAETKLYA